jgi:hypothetical protein
MHNNDHFLFTKITNHKTYYFGEVLGRRRSTCRWGEDPRDVSAEEHHEGVLNCLCTQWGGVRGEDMAMELEASLLQTPSRSRPSPWSCSSHMHQSKKIYPWFNKEKEQSYA